ncbi:MAG TPA: hypothetical protein VFF11_01130, partial [Candidatus Binatia bacterium]|nr:hypothetical protein [Candidatus Binatia bacterium]
LEIMNKLMTRFPDAKISRRVAERLGKLKSVEEQQNTGPGVKPDVSADASAEVSAQVSGRKYVSNLRMHRRD